MDRYKAVRGAKWSNNHYEYLIVPPEWESQEDGDDIAVIHATKDSQEIARQMAAAPLLMLALKRLTRIASVELTHDRWSEVVSQAIDALSSAQAGD